MNNADVSIKESPILLNNLGVELQAKGSFHEADASYKQSLAIWEAQPGPNHPLIAQSLSNRASLYREMQVYPEAERVFQLAAKIWNRIGWPERISMRPLDQGADLQQEAAWAEFPERTRLHRYGEQVQQLRDALIDEEKSGRIGPAREEVDVILGKLGPWFHNVPLTANVNTRPELPEHPANRWQIIEPFMPKDLSGKTVLDIGCNAGFFSLEVKRRGAAHVLGVDIMPHILAQSRFTSHWFDLPLELLEWDVYDVDALGRFDIVIFLGVLYHLQHPLYALQKVEKACGSTLFFQSAVRGSLADFVPADDYPMTETAVFDHPAYPKLYFVEKSFNGDESNWWMATRSCLKAMLRVAGFAAIQDTEGLDIFVCRKQASTTIGDVDATGEQISAKVQIEERFQSVAENPFSLPLRDYDINPFIHPTMVRSGYAGHLIDMQGKDYVDFLSAWGSNLLGYGYRKVVRAAARQLKQFNSLGLPYPHFQELMTLIRRLVPSAEEVRYGKNGSDACAGAVRLARFITGREKILYHGYHGFHDWYFAAVDCPGIPLALKPTVIPQEDLTPAAVDAVFRQHPGEIAGLILNPLTSPIPNVDEMRETIDVVHKHSGLVIFDEMMSGFRVAPGGMQEIWGVKPDLSCFGKSIANGLPLSVLCGKSEYMRRLPETFYGMTFEGEAVSIAAAYATLTEVIQKNVVQALYEKGRRIRGEYQRLAEAYSLSTSLVGYEPCMHIDFQEHGGIPSRQLLWLTIQELVRNGILTCGAFIWCYSHSSADVRKVEKALGTALSVVRKAVDRGTTEGLLDARIRERMQDIKSPASWRRAQA